MMRCLKYGAQGRGSFSRRLSRAAAAARNGQGRRPRPSLPPSVDPIGDRWSRCRMECTRAGMHACHSGMRTGNSRMANQRGRTHGRKAAFAIGSRVASSFPLCCPTNLGLPDIAAGNKFETSVGASAGPLRPAPVDAVIAISNLRSSIMIHEAMRMDGS